jgi:hypothetical protein
MEWLLPSDRRTGRGSSAPNDSRSVDGEGDLLSLGVSRRMTGGDRYSASNLRRAAP